MERQPQNFWQHVDKTGDCWIWTAGKSGRYGVLRWGEDNKVAHRVAWELTNGAIPEGMELDHDDDCVSGYCVNPEHLTPRSKSDHAHRHHPRRSHCSKGHALEGWNRMPKGTCRTCHNEKQNQRRNPAGLPSNGAKTHCPKGHEYTEENTYFIERKTRGTVERRCRKCQQRRTTSG